MRNPPNRKRIQKLTMLNWDTFRKVNRAARLTKEINELTSEEDRLFVLWRDEPSSLSKWTSFHITEDTIDNKYKMLQECV